MRGKMCPTDDEHFYFGSDILVDPQSDTIIFLAVTKCVFYTTINNSLKLSWSYDKVVGLIQTDQIYF